MRQIILLFGVLLGVLLAPCFGQESTTYYFLGNVFSHGAREGAELRQPYLVVTMAKESAPEDIIAVGMTNGLGVLSFRGVPIDISQPYVFSFDLPSGTHRYVSTVFVNPSFKSGNVNINMRLDSLEEYVDLREIVPTSEDKDKNALDIATSAIEGAVREGISIRGTEGLNYKLLLNGTPLYSERLVSAVESLTGEMVEKIVVAHPRGSNDFYAGAIDIFIPTDKPQSIQPTRGSIRKLE